MSNKRPPASLADLPAHLVAARSSINVEELRRWAGEAGQRFVHVDLSACDDRKAVLREIGRALDFPDWYGANLDALYDCLTDLAEPGAPGLVVVLDQLPRTARFDKDERTRLIDVFRDALEPFSEAGVPLRVYYR
ncbi:MAG: barstar family protein [Gemmatimonadota bacterium]